MGPPRWIDPTTAMYRGATSSSPLTMKCLFKLISRSIIHVYSKFNAQCWKELNLDSPCDGSSDRSFMVDPLSYFSFQPVFHDWCNKARGMCYPVCGVVYIKEPLLLFVNSVPDRGAGEGRHLCPGQACATTACSERARETL